MKADEIIYRNKFIWTIKYQKLAIADYVMRAKYSGFRFSADDINEIYEECKWEWSEVQKEFHTTCPVNTALIIIGTNYIVHNHSTDAEVYPPSLN